MSHQINIIYNAPEKIADPAALVTWIQGEVKHYVHSRTEGLVNCSEINVKIVCFESSVSKSEVAIDLSGHVNNILIEESFRSIQKRPKLTSLHDYMYNHTQTWRRKHSPVLVLIDRLSGLTAGIFQMIRPSLIFNAIGRPSSYRRDIQAFNECLAELRLTIDRSINRNGFEWSKFYYRGLWLTIIAVALAVGTSIYLGSNSTETTKSSIKEFAKLALAWSMPGLLYGLTLLWLPKDFYLAERAGRRVLKSTGLRSPSGLRMVAGILSFTSLALFLFGIYGLIA